jgi:hypothetical protein
MFEVGEAFDTAPVAERTRATLIETVPLFFPENPEGAVTAAMVGAEGWASPAW